MTKLDRDQASIIRSLFPDEPDRWIDGIQSETLTSAEIERACDALSGEFHMNGIDENFEATEYGRLVEALLDVVNRPRLRASAGQAS